MNSLDALIFSVEGLFCDAVLKSPKLSGENRLTELARVGRLFKITRAVVAQSHFCTLSDRFHYNIENVQGVASTVAHHHHGSGL